MRNAEPIRKKQGLNEKMRNAGQIWKISGSNCETLVQYDAGPIRKNQRLNENI